jgi:hypothetical protein
METFLPICWRFFYVMTNLTQNVLQNIKYTVTTFFGGGGLYKKRAA